MSYNPNYVMYGGAIPEKDRKYIKITQDNNPGFVVNNPNSYHYHDVITHIPVQRINHAYASYDYRTNQMVKHAFEDGYLNLSQLNQHTSKMNEMSSKDAFNYAVNNIDFSKKHTGSRN